MMSYLVYSKHIHILNRDDRKGIFLGFYIVCDHYINLIIMSRKYFEPISFSIISNILPKIYKYKKKYYFKSINNNKNLET